MSAMYSRPSKVTMLLENDQQVQFVGLVSSISMDQPVERIDSLDGSLGYLKRGPTEVEISMVLTEESKLTWSQIVDPSNFEPEPKPAPPPAEEWTCRYCGTAQPRAHRWCDRCGGPRGGWKE